MNRDSFATNSGSLRSSRSRSGTAAPRDRCTGLPPPIGRPPARAAWFACTGSRSQRATNGVFFAVSLDIVGPRGNVHIATDIVRYRRPGDSARLEDKWKNWGFSDAEIKGRAYWDQRSEEHTSELQSALQPRFSL